MIQIIACEDRTIAFPIFGLMRLLISLIFIAGMLPAQQKPARPFYTNSKPYDQVIAEFKELDRSSNIASLSEYGSTDAGVSLHYMVLSRDQSFTAEQARQRNRCVIMINNAIHPGEPDGVDASIELVKTYRSNPSLLPENVVLVIIPIYNPGGYLNRGNTSRVNQNGPEQYGFRGSAMNLDLNRDFIKADAPNTQTLQRLFQVWKPDVFIDNHVSDGADYQYTMTLIATQRNKLHPLLAGYMDKKLVPGIYADMERIGNPICPYVETMGETPESGIVGFLETPRFATGYAALFNCIGFVTETHMLKPYNDRVWATYDLMMAMINRVSADAAEIMRLHKEADEAVKTQEVFTLAWELDTTQYDMIGFKGYESSHVISKVSGLPVLYYDRSKPYTRTIRYYNTYKPKLSVKKPAMYVIPRAWLAVREHLIRNGVKMHLVMSDTVIDADFYTISNVNHPRSPYEGHYLHQGTQVVSTRQKCHVRSGDWIVYVNQSCNRFIVETLEPQGDDSFFAWNFFDPILNQKEWFSDYVFDAKAEQIIVENPAIKAQLDSAKRVDSVLATSHWLQMNFIYQRSLYKEPTHNRYPVARFETEVRIHVSPGLK